MLPWGQQASIQMRMEQAAAWGSVWQLQGFPKFHSQWIAAWFFKSASEQELDYRKSSAWHKPRQRLELPVPAWAPSHTHPHFCSKALPTPALSPKSPAHTNTAFQSPARVSSSSNSPFQSSRQGSHFHGYLCTTCGSPKLTSTYYEVIWGSFFH